jgi:hypothetical protein
MMKTIKEAMDAERPNTPIIATKNPTPIRATMPFLTIARKFKGGFLHSNDHQLPYLLASPHTAQQAPQSKQGAVAGREPSIWDIS